MASTATPGPPLMLHGVADPQRAVFHAAGGDDAPIADDEDVFDRHFEHQECASLLLTSRVSQPGENREPAAMHLGLRTDGEVHLVDGAAQPRRFGRGRDGVGDVLCCQPDTERSVVPVLMLSVIAVCTYSGHIAITRMPYRLHSRSSASVMPRTKNFVAL